MTVPFNRPHQTGREQQYVLEAIAENTLCGNGTFTSRCQTLLQERYGFHRVLLTTSCTDALEMAAMLLRIEPGDEVIMPSYTFVSTANAFVVRGARIVFADSREDHPCIDEASIESLITARTKAIVVVHYAGVACDMDIVMDIARRRGLKVVEDAAQALDATYRGRPLGGIGHLATFSFHATKNVQSGEGGALVINDPDLVSRAEILWEKGTNRAAFFRGEVDKYTWVDIGSSFLPGELTAAYLLAQLESIDDIQARRTAISRAYEQAMKGVFANGRLTPRAIPDYASDNGHAFYAVCRSGSERDQLVKDLRRRDVQSVFHYQSLHVSPYYKDRHDGRPLPNSDRYSDCLVRLPLFYDLSANDLAHVVSSVKEAVGIPGPTLRAQVPLGAAFYLPLASLS